MAYTRSILRYPGGKTRFAPFIQEALSLNKARVRVFAEPFCGGAGVAISLLEAGQVDSVALNDSDPLIAALWRVVFSEDAQWLAEQVRVVPLSVDEWKRLKASTPTSDRDLALKALYLNRTSFNGILHKSGPLGGWNQTNRTLDVRFPREKLANRILELSDLSDRVRSIRCFDWRDFVDELKQDDGVFLYFDPPYFHKAEQLYGHYFNLAEHIAFRDFVEELTVPWLLSYDDAREIRELYKPLRVSARVIDSTYSAHPIGGASFVGRELFFSNMKKLPSPDEDGCTHIGMSVKQYQKRKRASESAARIPWTQAAVEITD
ncbi:DNA adenine methylase [Derxia lacustris]|uniref:DNA adenine methylase n=1 Tax=Derxia lacustris TaxID=764842 RepID=UPI0015932EAC|nr:DNA adenine methylase [Derxia lacustris]